MKIDVGDGTLRDALSVRAIPYVAGWDDEFSVPPWSLAIRLQTNINLHAWDIAAFRLLDGKPVEVQPRQWVMVATQLAGFSEKLHRLFPRDEHQKPSNEGVAEWQSQAVEKLPARAFVWLDEFKAEYRGWFGRKFKSIPNLVIPEFDLAPLLSEEVRKMVLEGFEQATPAEDQSAQNLLDERDQLNADIKRWEAKDESVPSEALIKEKELKRLHARLSEVAEKIRDLRGDYLEQKSKVVALIPADDGWKLNAQNLAREIIKRQKTKDLYPNLIDIADEIARKFREDGICGKSGTPLSGETIKRHALKGINSAKAKRLSMTNTSGKRGK